MYMFNKLSTALVQERSFPEEVRRTYRLHGMQYGEEECFNA